jgi:hypothetical protein
MAEANGEAPGAANPAFEKFDDIEKRTSVAEKKTDNSDTEF